MSNVYKSAWSKFKAELDKKTGWGKNELKALMAKCLEEAVEEASDGG